MKVKVNDKVLVIAGKDHGKSGRVMRVMAKADRVVVEKINIRTKHIKKTQTKAGERIKMEGSIHCSNVVIICPSCNKPTRAGYKVLENGKKERICKKCNQSLNQHTADTGVKTKTATKKIKAI